MKASKKAPPKKAAKKPCQHRYIQAKGKVGKKGAIDLKVVCATCGEPAPVVAELKNAVKEEVAPKRKPNYEALAKQAAKNVERQLKDLERDFLWAYVQIKATEIKRLADEEGVKVPLITDISDKEYNALKVARA